MHYHSIADTIGQKLSAHLNATDALRCGKIFPGERAAAPKCLDVPDLTVERAWLCYSHAIRRIVSVPSRNGLSLKVGRGQTSMPCFRDTAQSPHVEQREMAEDRQGQLEGQQGQDVVALREGGLQCLPLIPTQNLNDAA